MKAGMYVQYVLTTGWHYVESAEITDAAGWISLQGPFLVDIRSDLLSQTCERVCLWGGPWSVLLHKLCAAPQLHVLLEGVDLIQMEDPRCIIDSDWHHRSAACTRAHSAQFLSANSVSSHATLL